MCSESIAVAQFSPWCGITSYSLVLRYHHCLIDKALSPFLLGNLWVLLGNLWAVLLGNLWAVLLDISQEIVT